MVPTRVYVDSDGKRVDGGSSRAVRLFAPAGTLISEQDADRLGLPDDEDSEPVAEHRCSEPGCDYEAKSAAGLGAHRRRHKGGS